MYLCSDLLIALLACSDTNNALAHGQGSVSESGGSASAAGPHAG